MKKSLRILLFTVLFPFAAFASANDTVIFTPLGHYYFTPANNGYSGYTPLIDRLGRPYLYLVTKEAGLVTFDISNTMNPVVANTQPVSVFNNLKPSAVAQDSNYLFVGLGDFESGQTSGLAIFNITNPQSPVLLDQWDSTVFSGGVGQVVWQGNYAYLAGMTEGVIILNIANKQNIQFVSSILPDPNFGPHAYTYHSRGLCLNHDTLLVADDNGGLRVIDVTNKNAPSEIGLFISPNIEANGNHAIYNHVHRLGDYAYCTMDYCSWSVVNVANPAAMTEVAWQNTFGAQNALDWFGSPGHTNELVYDAPTNIMMVSGTATEVLAFDPAIPAQPRLMGKYGNPNDSIAAWGVDVYGNLVVAAIIHNPFNWPYNSIEGGIQLLNFSVLTGMEEETTQPSLTLFPNPANESCNILLPACESALTIDVLDISGRIVLTQNVSRGEKEYQLDLSSLSSGMYTVRVSGDRVLQTAKVVKE